jgi:hypothetical protein
MFEWFKQNDIGRKLQAAVDDLINGGSWGPFEGLEKGAALIRVTLAKGEVIRFEKYVPPITGGSTITELFIPFDGTETISEEPLAKEKPRRKRT